jgi:hypothetical protein
MDVRSHERRRPASGMLAGGLVAALLAAWVPGAPAAPIPDSLTGSQRAAVEEFLAARATGNTQELAGALHPSELEELRTRILNLLHEEARHGDSTVRSRLFGQAMPIASIERLTPSDFFAAIATRLSLPGRPYERVHALAAVPGRNGNVHAIVEAVQPKERGSKVEVVELVTLRPYGKDWKAAIPEELEAQIDDLIHARSSVALAPAASPAALAGGVATPPGITELLNSAEQSLSAGKCDEYYKQRMSESFRRVTSKKALEMLINSCQNNAGMREMLLATLRIVRGEQPRFEYDGQRAVYDLKGQGLPFDTFTLEQVDRHWYIAE